MRPSLIESASYSYCNDCMRSHTDQLESHSRYIADKRCLLLHRASMKETRHSPLHHDEFTPSILLDYPVSNAGSASIGPDAEFADKTQNDRDYAALKHRDRLTTQPRAAWQALRIPAQNISLLHLSPPKPSPAATPAESPSTNRSRPHHPIDPPCTYH
jgi:hypothetical protein